MSTLFISDLHLSDSRDHNRPLVTEAFFSFLQTEARGAETLYILGDLFDAWVGDDDNRPLALRVAEALKTLAGHGTKIFFQHGNRDFLLGHDYAKRCGMQLLPDLFILEVGQERWLLAHGDQFCMEDTAYQQFRQQVRQPKWKKELLEKSLDERRQIAAQLREKSREANSLKAADIMDVTPAEVMRVMAEKQCQKLIHGHTHRPARHTHTLPDKRTIERIVLGEWDSTFWFIRQKGLSIELCEQALV